MVIVANLQLICVKFLVQYENLQYKFLILELIVKMFSEKLIIRNFHYNNSMTNFKDNKV